MPSWPGTVGTRKPGISAIWHSASALPRRVGGRPPPRSEHDRNVGDAQPAHQLVGGPLGQGKGLDGARRGTHRQRHYERRRDTTNAAATLASERRQELAGV